MDEAELLSRIDAFLADVPDANVEGEAGPGARDLEAELRHFAVSPWTPDALTLLDRLRKKIEVARKLCRYYLPDLSLAAAAVPLSSAGVQRLCGLLLKSALLSRDARYLNAALKLLDGVLDRADCIFPDTLRALAVGVLDVLVPPPYPA